MIKCKKNDETLGVTKIKIKGTIKEMLAEFLLISKTIADIMLENEFSEEYVIKILTACVNQGIEEAKEANK